MGIKKLDKSNQIQQRPNEREPDYRNEKNGIQAAVWEGRRNGVYFIQLKLSRRYVDGSGRTQFTNSFEFSHIEDLIVLLNEVQKDMAEAISEEVGNNSATKDKEFLENLM